MILEALRLEIQVKRRKKKLYLHLPTGRRLTIVKVLHLATFGARKKRRKYQQSL